MLRVLVVKESLAKLYFARWQTYSLALSNMVLLIRGENGDPEIAQAKPSNRTRFAERKRWTRRNHPVRRPWPSLKFMALLFVRLYLRTVRVQWILLTQRRRDREYAPPNDDENSARNGDDDECMVDEEFLYMYKMMQADLGEDFTSIIDAAEGNDFASRLDSVLEMTGGKLACRDDCNFFREDDEEGICRCREIEMAERWA